LIQVAVSKRFEEADVERQKTAKAKVINLSSEQKESRMQNQA
jgi:hypothetical protein